MQSFPDSRAVARINGKALFDNFKVLLATARRARPTARLIAVVKDNAYGHGAACVLPVLLSAGCDAFAVATPEEGLEVRRLAPQADILVLGYTPPALAPLLAEAKITQTVFSLPYALALSRAMEKKGTLSVQLKVDGGMCRLGLLPTDTEALFSALRTKNLRSVGLYTHFPSADSDKEGTRRILGEFLRCRRTLAERGFPLFCHAAASAALLELPESVLDGARAGIALYGLPHAPLAPLRPVLSLHAPLIRLLPVPAGTPVGYGGDFVTRRPSLIGTLPIGYGDGLPRAMQGASVTLSCPSGRFSVPLVGRICMDCCTVDLTHTPARIGDEVCLFDSAATVAARLGRIPYEVLTALSPRIKRELIAPSILQIQEPL